MEQESQSVELSEDTLQLISQYNDIISTLTETFMQMDQKLRKIENETEKKKPKWNTQVIFVTFQ